MVSFDLSTFPLLVVTKILETLNLAVEDREVLEYENVTKVVFCDRGLQKFRNYLEGCHADTMGSDSSRDDLSSKHTTSRKRPATAECSLTTFSEAFMSYRIDTSILSIYITIHHDTSPS